MTDTDQKIKMYGTSWCGDCRRARNFFAENKIEYEWVDIDLDKDAVEYVKSVNKGCKSVPTILFPDGTLLVEPSSYQLKERFGLK
ncbi:MAG: mycoredoxin [Anaerolineae bacterium]|nr:mycoredoxin [Anaerolineae bacterium]